MNTVRPNHEPVRPEFTSEVVHRELIAKLAPVKMNCPREECRVLERQAEEAARKYFRKYDTTTTCMVIITDDVYCMYVFTGEIAHGIRPKNYSYYSDRRKSHSI